MTPLLPGGPRTAIARASWCAELTFGEVRTRAEVPASACVQRPGRADGPQGSSTGPATLAAVKRQSRVVATGARWHTPPAGAGRELPGVVSMSIEVNRKLLTFYYEIAHSRGRTRGVPEPLRGPPCGLGALGRLTGLGGPPHGPTGRSDHAPAWPMGTTAQGAGRGGGRGSLTGPRGRLTDPYRGHDPKRSVRSGLAMTAVGGS